MMKVETKKVVNGIEVKMQTEPWHIILCTHFVLLAKGALSFYLNLKQIFYSWVKSFFVRFLTADVGVW